MKLASAVHALLAFLVFQSAQATTYYERSPEEMVLAADMIFVATVEAVRDHEAALLPWTEVAFEVEEWLAHAGRPVGAQDGSTDELPDTVSLEFLGGTTPSGDRVTVSGVPQFRQGQRVLVLAYDDGGLASPIVGVRQGVWSLDAAGARDEDGAYLRVPSPGRLARAPSGAGLEEVLAAVRSLLETGAPEAGTAPTAETSTDAGTDAGTADAEPNTDAGADPAAPDEEQASGAPEATDAPRILVRYSVNESGGPLLLSAAVEGAAQAWQSAAPAAVLFERVTEDPEAPAGTAAPHTIGYGEPAWYGPDAASFTLVRSGSSVTEVLVSPAAGAALGAALLHELGVLIGLPEAGDGVMRSAVTAGAVTPAAADLAALTALQAFRPEDINRDGVVDFYDLAALAAAFGGRGVNLAADLNGDGVVDEVDLEVLRLSYQFLPPSETPPPPY